MSTALIQSLLQPPSQIESNSKARGIINAQFNSIDDLDKLDALLVDARQQHESIQARSLTSQAQVDKLIDETRFAAERLLENARELALQRHTLADELVNLSRALQPQYQDEDGDGDPKGTSRLLDDLDTMHRNLKELESVKDYVLVLEKALSLSESALEQIRADAPVTSELLRGYKQLQEYTSSITQLVSTASNEATTDQKLHLVTFLERVRDKTWVDIRTYFFNKLIDAAEKLGWPAPMEYLATPQADRRTFEIAFMSLLKLQMLAKKLHGTKPTVDKDGLYPIQALVQPISLRFKYHFEGTRQTNKLDKPEWYFTHVQNVAHEHKLFFTTVIQGLLDRTDFKTTSAWKEFTFLLLPLLTRKIKKTIPQLLEHPSLLAHTIYEALSFDVALSEEGFSLDGTSALEVPERWEGISHFILGNPDWFEAWVTGEQNFVEDQYNELISSPDAWLVADGGDDADGSEDLRPTNSARKVKALVEQVTDRCSSLPNPVQRAHFLVKIQLPLLDSYHGRISSSLDAFETLTSVFMRAVPGALGVSLRGGEVNMQVDPRNLTSGSAGVNRLCKALLSSTYIKAALDGWSDDVFFVQLWSEFGKNEALAYWAEAVPFLPHVRVNQDATDATAFSVIIEKYQTLATRAEDMIVQLICSEAESGLKTHYSTPPVSSPDPRDLALSPTLLVPMSALSTHLTSLRGIMPKTAFTTLYRRIAKRLAEFIFQHQIMYRGQFSSAEAKVVHSEVELWVETCCVAVESALGGGRLRVQAPWSRTLEAARLIGLDGEVRVRAMDVTFGACGEEEWESVMRELVELSELERDEAGSLLRRRVE